MAYQEKIYDLGACIEHELCYAGTCGGKREKRGTRVKPTSEAQQKINQRNRETLIRRKIVLNFRPGDLWVTLKYPKGARKPIREVMKDWAEFGRRMRAAYKKAGEKFKYIYRIEIGKLGGIHIHLILNRIEGTDTGLLVNDCWTMARHKEDPEPAELCGRMNGYADIEYMYGSGDYEKLAAYIVKAPSSDDGQMYFAGLGLKEKKAFLRYGCSRNLKKPVAVKKEYHHWTMRRILKDGPKPKPGYYIDKDSIVCGVNPYTGWSYYHYREIRLDPVKGKKGSGEVIGWPGKEAKEWIT